jgi:hypothetical protein
MEIVHIPLAELESNIGQIPDLPMNPRQWTKTDIDQLARSLSETPELFEARPLLVVPHDGKFVILGGNLRFEASKQNKATTVPAIVFPAETPIAKLKEIVIKDNGAFGEWDMDALANEWDDLPLADWGVPAWNPDKDEYEIPTELDAEDKNKPFVLKVTFPDSDSMTRFVVAYKDILENDFGCTISESGGEL